MRPSRSQQVFFFLAVLRASIISLWKKRPPRIADRPLVRSRSPALSAMSLWWIGPDATSVSLEAPKAPPNPAQRVPRLMKNVSNCRFVQVACGGGHAMAITHDGRLFGWGWNAYGQCGLGDDLGSSVAAPRAIGRLTGRTCVAVACGAAHTIALVETREFYENETQLSVFGWGAHHAGQLGHDAHQQTKIKSYSVPVVVSCLHNVAGRLAPGGGLDGGGELGVVDDAGARIRQPLSCGVAHSCLVARDGALYTWGANTHGQCGRAGKSEEEKMTPGPVKALEAHARVVGVACGGAHTLA